MGSRRRLKSANPGNRPSPAESLNTTLPARSSLFDFECVATDLVSLLQESELAKKSLLQENAKEKAQWKARCKKLRERHADLLAKNTELRNQVAVRQQGSGLDEVSEDELRAATQCVSVTQLGSLKYMNQELQTAVEELRDAVDADEYLYLG